MLIDILSSMQGIVAALGLHFFVKELTSEERHKMIIITGILIFGKRSITQLYFDIPWQQGFDI